MMIRSAPPCSAHLADRPVPAPAPTRRSPRATADRSLAFQSGLSVVICFLSCRRAHHSAQFQKHLGRAICKDRVVDIAVDFDHRYSLVQAGADGVKASMVGLRIPKRLAWRI